MKCYNIATLLRRNMLYYSMSKTQQTEYQTPMLKFLQSKGVDFTSKEHESFTLQHCEERSSHSNRTCIHGMMDLIVESWYEGKIMKVSVCHYYEQNGDLMTDPEIVYKVNPEMNSELPEYFKQDGTFGREQNVFSEDGLKYKPQLLKELQSFTKTWVRNLKDQGHELVEETD